MKKKIIGGLLAVLTVTALVGCTPKDSSKDSKKDDTSSKVSKKKKTADKKKKDEGYSRQEQIDLIVSVAQTQVASIKKQQSDTYSDISITSKKDTIVYTYVLKEQTPAIDSAALKPTLVKQVNSLFETMTETIPGLKMQFLFLNPDKSEVANITVTEDDLKQAETATDS
ncbi:hypothetical protein Q2T76_04030 [Lactobacillus sp. YT155]|uniref:hypothetical protein n=1 Tax=Lactobacillus sp. YT155 TaxID=3060955 RepID=UPI00265F8EAE|nr:hypothetical protein [Lactobacillus sp. YT155]MDO1605223.1 hypothetical protein [Lactobacillus sp. YT155]